MSESRRNLAYSLRRLGEARDAEDESAAAQWEEECSHAALGLEPHLFTAAEADALRRDWLTSAEVCSILQVTRGRVDAMKNQQGSLAGTKDPGSSMVRYEPESVWQLYQERKERGDDLRRGGRNVWRRRQ